MSSRPDASDLLDTARGALLQKLLPALPGNLQYEARMIASAMALAAREMELAEGDRKIEWDGLMKILGETVQATAVHLATPIEINRARRKLSNAIRDGLFDHADDRQRMLLDTLTRIARSKLAISNPKILQALTQ